MPVLIRRVDFYVNLIYRNSLTARPTRARSLAMTRKPGRPKADPRAYRAWRKHRPRSISPLAKKLGITVPAVSKWPYVPEARHVAVADFLGLSMADLRPDLYDPWTI